MKRTTLAVVWVILPASAAPANAQSTILLVDVVSPAPPIRPTETISIRATTLVDVFPDTGHEILSSFAVNGSDIEWEITSYDRGGVVLPVLLPMRTISDIGPLEPGTYQVTVQWQHLGFRLLHGAPSSGTGFFTLSVIPEPGSCLMMAGAAAVLLRRRQRLRDDMSGRF
jgi:hypothetical protein